MADPTTSKDLTAMTNPTTLAVNQLPLGASFTLFQGLLDGLSDASSLCFKALPLFFEAVFIHWIGGLGTFLEAWIFLFKASPRLISVTKQLS